MSAFSGAAKKPPPKYTVFVSAPSGQDQEDVPQTVAAVRTKLLTDARWHQGSQLRQTAGGRVVLEVQSAGDLEKLKTHQGLKASGLQISPPY